MNAKRASMTVVLAVVAAGAVGAAPPGDAPLDADLCNFAIEGLTLASTQADVAEVFAPREWHDLTLPPATSRNRQTVQEVVFDQQRPTPGPNARTGAESANRFGMTIADGRPRGMTLYGDALPSGQERARALCARFDDRFTVSGCRPEQLATPWVSVSAQPKAAVGGEYCQVHLVVPRRGPSRWALSVARHQGTPPAPTVVPGKG